MNLESGFPPRRAEEADPRPIVSLPRSGVPGAVIAGFAIAAAILLFLLLDGRRQRQAEEQQSGTLPATAFVAPPPLAIPQAPATPAPGYILYPPQPAPPLIAQPPRQNRQISVPGPQYYAPPPQEQAYQPVEPLYAPAPAAQPQMPGEGQQAPPSGNEGPAVVIGSAITHGTPAAGPPAAGNTSASISPPGEQGAAGQPSKITRMANPDSIIMAGTLISAVLETPVDTARPGLVRAIVSKDARGFGGRQVLVPRGSRLIGAYQSEIGPGQNRVLVGWTRIIRPDGSAISLAAPSTDATGGAGIPGRVHGFFLSRFFNAAFQSALAIGENLATRQTNTVIVGLPNGAVTNVAGQSLIGSGGPRRKITVRQGTLVNVFVAQDIDFSSAAGGS